MEEQQENLTPWIITAVFIALVVVGFIMFGMPVYNVWQKEMTGKAQLAEAEWNRQIIIKEAESNFEGEKLNAKAEIERAKGMAEAIEIEGGKLNETYIKYLWVRQNKFNDKTVIYIPTEANLPILEAKDNK